MSSRPRRTNPFSLTLLNATGGALLALACSQKPAPLTAPSGELASYAEVYPTKLTGVREAYARDESEARTAIAEFKPIPDSLKGADFTHVKAVVERADAAGRSSSYTEAALEGQAVERFMTEEKEPLRQKVAGGVNYAAKQKNIEEDLGGAAVASMERGVDKQLEERLRRHGDAHRYIEEHQEELGRANVEPLEKHADRIARTSHIVHVRLEMYRRELEQMLGDASTVKGTLDRVIRENDAVLTDANASRNKKQVAERRKQAAQNARNRIDIDVEQAERARGEIETRIQGVQKEYATALDALMDDLDQRIAQAGTQARN